jgi:hypothetical protein
VQFVSRKPFSQKLFNGDLEAALPHPAWEYRGRVALYVQIKVHLFHDQPKAAGGGHFATARA